MAKHLVHNGAKELILVAQETTLYGTDLYGKKSLPMLIHELAKIEDLKWIRILFSLTIGSLLASSTTLKPLPSSTEVTTSAILS